MQQLYGEEKINTGDDCFFDEDNRTFSLSYQVYVYDYIHISTYTLHIAISITIIWNHMNNKS